MIYKSYKAPSYKDAVLQAKMDLGNNVYIIGRKEVKEGGFMGMFAKTFTEITVAKSEEGGGEAGAAVRAPVSGRAAGAEQGGAPSAAPASQGATGGGAVQVFRPGSAATPRESSVSNAAPATRAAHAASPAFQGAAAVQAGQRHAVPEGQPDPARAFTDAAILKELLDIKKRLKEFGDAKPSSPHLEKMVAVLKENDFSEEFIEKLRCRFESELTLREVLDPKIVEEKMKSCILESIETSGPIKIGKGKPTTVVLAGPTGVGKTTTIAKLAATYGILQKRKVEILTIDSYRIAAIEQLGKYAELMQLPFSVINTREEFKCAVQNSKAELVFVDTAGRSPKNSLGIAELRDILDGVRSNLEVHLVVSATTKYRDALDVFTRFNQLMYSKVIVTKLDEANTIGPLVSVLGRDKQLSYLTTGQSVPDDIELAEKDKILSMLIVDEFRAG